MRIRIFLWFESRRSEIAMQMKQFFKGVWDLKVGRSEIAMQTERIFKAIWDFKPVWVHLGSHVNLLLRRWKTFSLLC